MDRPAERHSTRDSGAAAAAAGFRARYRESEGLCARGLEITRNKDEGPGPGGLVMVIRAEAAI